MALPEYEIATRVRHWGLFGSGTFSRPVVPGLHLQRKLVFAYLYQVAHFKQVPFKRLLWATRQEAGEIGGREHYHWLIGIPGWKPTTTERFQLMALWDGLPKCGFARVYPFETGRNSVEYISKCLTSQEPGEDRVGASCYESRKFGHHGSAVTLSNSVVRLVGGRRVCVLRYRCEAQEQIT